MKKYKSNTGYEKYRNFFYVDCHIILFIASGTLKQQKLTESPLVISTFTFQVSKKKPHKKLENVFRLCKLMINLIHLTALSNISHLYR